MTTNYAKARFSEIYDLHTEIGRPMIMGVHTPTNGAPRTMLSGFFNQFKKFRYVGCDIVFVPVSTLPADPLQIGYEAGEPTIDPRDMVNPIIHRGFHGESLGGFLNQVFPNTSANDLGNLTLLDENNFPNPSVASSYEQSYYLALSDPSFLKAGVQAGFKRDGLVPLCYDLSASGQILPYPASNSLGNDAGIEFHVNEAEPTQLFIDTSAENPNTANVRVDKPALFTSRLSPLGWLDCESRYSYNPNTSVTGQDASTGVFSYLPRLFMYFIMLPPAYKTEFYFRVVLTHHFEFKDFRSCAAGAPFVGRVTDNSQSAITVAYEDPNVATASMTDLSLEVHGGVANPVTAGVS